MAGSREQGLKAAKTNLANDPDHYRKIALKAQEAWERNGRKPRGFAVMDKERLSEVGSRGGSASRRGKAKKKGVR